MNELPTQSFIDGAVATGLGLFIGLEREHSDHDPGDGTGKSAEPRRDHLGVRTFALIALLGWLCRLLEPAVPHVVLVGLLAVGALVGMSYVRTWQDGAGITTEIAALVTFGLGLVVQQSRLLATALALVVTLLLFAKPWVRALVANIERRELLATLQLALMLAIVLPLLPAEPIDPWKVLAPRKIGLFVVLIAGLSFVGYVLSRLFGARRGAGISGLVGGLASSTAVTAAMAQRARETAAMIVPGQVAVFLANAVMFVRVVVVAAVLGRQVAVRLALPMGVMCAVMAGGALWKWRALAKADRGHDGAVSLQNPFALLPALKWGALLSAILVVAAVAREHFGDRGLLVAAVVSGFADVDAINVAVTRQAAVGALAVELAVLAVTVATFSNTATKALLAIVSGGWAFGRAIAAVFAVAMAAGLAAALLA